MNCVVFPWKIARKLAGLSQGVLARQAGVDQSRLSKVERRQGVAGPDFAAAVWSMIGPPGAPLEFGEWVRDPSSADISESWCCELSSLLDHHDPRWMTYVTKRWFPSRPFPPAFPSTDGPSLIWWCAAWSLSVDIPFPASFKDDLHTLPVGEIVNVFRAWVEAIIEKATGRTPSGVGPDDFPIDLWHLLDDAERESITLLVRRLATAH